MKITSTAFRDGTKMATLYTCEGQNISPPLAWSGVPEGTQSLALIMDDPDAPSGIFTHWVVFNIPPESLNLPSAAKAANLPTGTLQGRNSYGTIAYGGPCPPSGSPHHYRFILYALDQPTALTTGATREQLLSTTRSHVLAQARLVGLYQR
jgi:Raf kinase inhibitor-like YbhB/YbcL family protein